MKKHIWHAWDTNPGQQDGRRRRFHLAMAAPLIANKLLRVFLYIRKSCITWATVRLAIV